MENTQGVILLLADISGYTRFIRQHQAASHAHMIIVRLLKALVEASKPLFELVEIEGDAVFLFTSVPEGNPETFASRVKQQMLALFLQFNQEVWLLQQIQRCECEAFSSVGNLKLKQVLHHGEVAIEQIDKFEKLFGLDVIVVHRMLKNSVEASEYVMMTDPAYRSFGDFHGIELERRIEQFEGIGAVEPLVFYTSPLLEELYRTAPQRPPTPRLASTGWLLKLRTRSLVDFLRSHLGRSYSDEEEAFTGAAHRFSDVAPHTP